MILFYLHFFRHFDNFLTAEKVIFRFSICWFSSKFKLLFIINFEATLSQQIGKRKIYFFVINIPSALTLTLTPPPSSFPILTISFTKSEKTCYKSRVILIKNQYFSPSANQPHLSGQIVLRSLNSFVEVYNKTNWL